MSKDHCAEEGDVDGHRECCSALGMVAAEVRLHVAVQQAARTLSWVGTNDPVEERLQAEQNSKMQQNLDFQLGGPEKLIGPDHSRHALQEHGG